MIHPPFAPHTLLSLHRALTLWQDKGARLINLPWTAPSAALERTRPPFAGTDVHTPHGMLLASGEQAFFALDEEAPFLEGELLIGWSPCFRDEHRFDELHHYYFLKAELYRPLAQGEDAGKVLEDMISCAQDVFEHLGGVRPTRVELAPWQVDLELGGIEIGSYGCRPRPNGRPYFYGTALAEPRFTQALAQLKPAPGK